MKQLTVIILMALICLSTVNATELSVARKSKKKKTHQTEAVKPAEPVIITQTIWGCTVGSSTLRQVQDSLSDRGFSFEKSDGMLTVTNSDMKFGGYNWSKAIFRFSEGKLMEICFESKGYESFNAAASAYDALIGKLNVKYKAQRDTTARNSSDEKYDIYKDTYTRINLFIKQTQVTRLFVLHLNYTNLLLLNGYGKEDIKEL